MTALVLAFVALAVPGIAHAQALDSVALALNSVIGGVTVNARITLAAAAPAGGVVVMLSSNKPAATPLGSVTIPAGATQANAGIATHPVASDTDVTISATRVGVMKTATLTVRAPKLVPPVVLSNSIVTGGLPASVTVQLDGSAPLGGAVITLSTTNAALTTLPTPTVVPAGQRQQTFSIATVPVADPTPVTIGAAFNGGTQSAVLTVASPSVASITIQGAPALGAQPRVGHVVLNVRAPANGVVVQLSSSHAGAASVPATVTVPGNATHATFPVTTHAVTRPTAVTISASAGGKTLTTPLRVEPGR